MEGRHEQVEMRAGIGSGESCERRGSADAHRRRLPGGGEGPIPHEVFVHARSCYYYTEQQLFITGSQPVVRVRPGIPLRYTTGGWDFGWLLLPTDGRVVYRRCDPYTLKFNDMTMQRAMRWFVR